MLYVRLSLSKPFDKLRVTAYFQYLIDIKLVLESKKANVNG